MADTYSVKAILSATDKGFTSTLKSCTSALDKIDSKISGFTFGVFSGVGQKAFDLVTNSVSDLIGEVDDANASWKNYASNMRIIKGSGKQTERYIEKNKKALQEYAQQTVYSSSDMASTFAQLEAVGTQGTLELVKGFGGLAAAAENPQQAMKTLSQQATQMAAKPEVAWADFKLMLEQTPAGIAAVAKQMGMSTAEMVTAVQEGEITTQAFFSAIKKAGTSKEFTALATEAKTVGQAMDGLKETAANKLMPAFDLLSKKGIKAIEGISTKLSGLDGDAIADKVAGWVEKAQPYWETFKDIASDVGDALKKVGKFLSEHSETITKVLPWIVKLALAYKGFKMVSTFVAPVASFTKSIARLAGKGIGAIAGKLFGISTAQQKVGEASVQTGISMVSSAKAYALMGVAVLTIAAAFALLAFSAIQLANAGGLAIGVMAGLVVGVAAIGVGLAFLLKTLAPMGAQLVPVGTAFLAMGAAVLLVSAGFALLALASIRLANAGGLAIGIMVGMVAAVALLAVGAAALAPALTAGAVGLIAFGAAIVLVGVGAVLAGAALAIVSAVLPGIVAHGTAGATAIAALGASMIVFATGAAVAGAASLALGAGLAVAAVGIAAVGVASLVAAAGILAMAGGVTVLAASLILTGASLALVSALLPAAASGALAGTTAFAALLAVSLTLTASLTLLNAPLVLIGASSLVAGAGMLVFAAGMVTGAAGSVAMAAALKAVSSQMKTISSSAKSTEASLDSMRSSVKVVESGLDALGSKAKSAMDKLINAFDNSATKATSAGKAAGTGYASALDSGLNKALRSTKTKTQALVVVLKSFAEDAKSAGTLAGFGFTQGFREEMCDSETVAYDMINTVINTLNSGRKKAYNAGAYISKGFAQGMLSEQKTVEKAASEMTAAADKAVRAKAKIKSPSRVTRKDGRYFGEGWVLGIKDMVNDAWNMAERLVSFPAVQTPAIAGAYGWELSGDYDYSRTSEYTIIVPLDVDGREVAKATATYTQEELNRQQTRENRKKGKV